MKLLLDLSLLRHNRNFCRLYLGQFISFFGSMITGVALPYQIYHETHSTLMVGLLSLAQLLPLLITALLGGVLADRRHRQPLLISTELLLALGCLLLSWNASLATPHIWLLFIAATLMSAINGLHRPALESMTQQIVAKCDFPLLGSLSSFKFGVGMVAGPAVGGLLIAHMGLVATFSVDFATFFISLMFLLQIKNIPKPFAENNESALTSLTQGFRYALSKQELLGSYFVDFIAMIFGMPMALFPAIAQSHGGAKALGMLYSAPAIGALILSFFSGWVKPIKRHGVAIALSAGLWGIAIIAFGLARNIMLALFFLALAGALDALSGIFRGIMWNEIIPNHYRGRLAGIEMISYMSGPKLGDTEAGLVAAAFGITASVVSGGILCVLGVGICCYYLPKFWTYESNIAKNTLVDSDLALGEKSP